VTLSDSVPDPEPIVARFTCSLGRIEIPTSRRCVAFRVGPPSRRSSDPVALVSQPRSLSSFAFFCLKHPAFHAIRSVYFLGVKRCAPMLHANYHSLRGPEQFTAAVPQPSPTPQLIGGALPFHTNPSSRLRGRNKRISVQFFTKQVPFSARLTVSVPIFDQLQAGRPRFPASPQTEGRH